MCTSKTWRLFCASRLSPHILVALLALCVALAFVACKESVTRPDEVARMLYVLPPTFDDVIEGYVGTPASKKIVIENTGDATVTIKNVYTSSDFYIAGSGGTVAPESSIDTWTVRPKSGLSPGTYTAKVVVTYDGTFAGTAIAPITFVVMAKNRFIAVSSSDGKVAYSADGSKWKDYIKLSTISWQAITFGNSKFVAVGANRAAHSADGINWTEVSLTGNWCSVAYDNNKFVAVADDGKIAYSNNGGAAWINATQLTAGDWASVAYGNSKIVAVGTGGVAHSADNGSTWTDVPLAGNWRSVAYADSKFVAVADDGKIAHSSDDGASWTEVASAGSWVSLAYGASEFVAIAYASKKIAYSTNGAAWTAEDKLSSNANWNSVTYGNGKFVAVAGSSRKAAYSVNGITWTGAIMPAGDWQSVAYGTAP